MPNISLKIEIHEIIVKVVKNIWNFKKKNCEKVLKIHQKSAELVKKSIKLLKKV